MYESWKKRSRKEVSLAGTGAEADWRPRPNVKVNSHVRDELRSSKDIRKLRDEQKDNKKKNLSKDKRKQLDGRSKKRNADAGGMSKMSPKQLRLKNNMCGPNRKMKVIVRN